MTSVSKNENPCGVKKPFALFLSSLWMSDATFVLLTASLVKVVPALNPP